MAPLTYYDNADRLYALLFGDWKPKRASQMTGRTTQNGKYIDIADYSFSLAHLIDHLDGTETYAATLGLLGEARSGCKDYDSADEAEILAALEATAAKGITVAAFIMPGNRAHLWLLYDQPYPVADIRAQLRTIRRAGKGEDYPSGNPIGLPFRYHKVKRTRGVLVFQDGRRFTLDTPAGLSDGLAAFLALPLNGKPEPAPMGDPRSSGQTWGDAYKAKHWENLPDGGPLWRSPYIAAAAERRPDLARLLRGERVTLIKKDDTRDDSDSAQIAALAFTLLSADVCKQQARAIADYLYPTLRPSRTREHYRAHFDAELERYTPKHYKPQEIRYLGTPRGAELTLLPPAQHKPQPKSRARKDRPQKVAGALGYLEWLRTQVDPQSGSVMLSQAQCAARLGCNVRTIKRYKQQLGDAIERRVFAQRQAGCLFILAPDVVPTSPADVVIADAIPAQQHAVNADAAPMQEEHPAPLVPTPDPASTPTLTELVRDAFDAYPGRASFRKVRIYVEMNGDERPFRLDLMKALYERERDKRARDRAWQRLLASLPTMKAKKFTALSKRVDRILGDGPSGPERKFYRWASELLPHLSAEEERRAAMVERTRPRYGRTRTTEEHELFADIEGQIVAYRRERKSRRRKVDQGSGRGSVPPLAAGPVLSLGLFDQLTSDYDVPEMIARLKAQLIAHTTGGTNDR